MRNDLIAEDRRAVVHGREWSVAQLVQAAAGLLFVVLGGIVLARGGLSHLDNPQTVDAFFPQTVWLAILEIIGGLMLLGGAASARDRSLGIFTGLVFTAVGIIMAAAPDVFNGHLASGDSTAGIVFAIVGIIVAVACMLAPSRVAHTRMRSRVEDDIVE